MRTQSHYSHQFSNSPADATPNRATQMQRDKQTQRVRERVRERDRERERQSKTERERERERQRERDPARAWNACKYCDLGAAAAYEEAWMLVNIVIWR